MSTSLALRREASSDVSCFLALGSDGSLVCLSRFLLPSFTSRFLPLFCSLPPLLLGFFHQTGTTSFKLPSNCTRSRHLSPLPLPLLLSLVLAQVFSFPVFFVPFLLFVLNEAPVRRAATSPKVLSAPHSSSSSPSFSSRPKHVSRSELAEEIACSLVRW